ncbi:ammonium transporter [Methylotenera sp. L2L1]|uniref:ammonium transporter n=1 Tax=Methylotenera sp. L2L1 TaxID=1502770 RepID=UPI00069203BE|nr:ammonium transporter [Methylotenera sp. L2L1]
MQRNLCLVTSTFALGLLISPSAFANETISTIAINSTWVVLTGALVFLMQAGFAMLETGMSRSKNTVNIMMKNYMDLCVGSLIFWLVGYGLMFGSNTTGWFGTDHFALGYGDDWEFTLLFFNIMFASTAATIVSGAMAERTNYLAYLLGAAGITAVIYPVLGSWIWNDQGWLKQMGFIDFAGSTVVHSLGGWCALAGVVLLGPRLGRFSESGKIHSIPGHNIGMIGLGGFILWFGWFGFNAGSTLAVSTNIGLIVLNTQLSGAAGAVGAVLISAMMRKPILISNTVNGSIAGLVAITAGCATMDVPYAVLTGLIGGIISVIGVILLEKLRIDDVVGAISVHGFAGVWGTLAAGMFLKGNMFNSDQVIVQLIGISATFIWVFFAALIMYGLIKVTVGLRVSTMHEQRGLDITEHGEVAYPEFTPDAAYKAENLKHLQKL